MHGFVCFEILSDQIECCADEILEEAIVFRHRYCESLLVNASMPSHANPGMCKVLITICLATAIVYHLQSGFWTIVR
jgi:hypothetical protein